MYYQNKKGTFIMNDKHTNSKEITCPIINELLDYDFEEDDFEEVSLTLVMPSEIYKNLSCLAAKAELSIENYVIQMAAYGHIFSEPGKDGYYEV